MQIEDDIVATSPTEGVVIDVSEVVSGRRSRTDDLVVDLRDPIEPDAAADTERAPVSEQVPRGSERRAPEPGALHGRIAVVTGGSSGIGREIALGLASAGARVCVLGRDLAQLRETVDLAGPDSAILFLQCDVGSVTEIEGVVDFIERFDRPVDILVHAEGVHVRGGVEFGSVNDLDEQYLVNVRGPYVMSQRLLGQLRAGRGHVIFLNSSAAHSADVEFGQFSVTNHGLRALADTLRQEVQDSGVRVTSIYPAGVFGAPDSATLSAADIAASVLAAVQVSSEVEITDLHLRPRLGGATGATSGAAPGSADDSSV